MSRRRARTPGSSASHAAGSAASTGVARDLRAPRRSAREGTSAGIAAPTELARVARTLRGAPRRASPTNGAGIAAPTELARVARKLRGTPRRSSRAVTNDAGIAAADELARVARTLRGTPRRTAKERADDVRGVTTGAMDVATAPRAVALELIAGRAHYERIITAVLGAHTSVWIATANVKELMVEDARARPGQRRSLKRRPYVSVLALLDELAARGVELRLLHAEIPSGPFRAELAQHPRLVAGGLALARCPRVHLKAVIVDGALLYLGSANWTGAGLGAKGSGRRNFELGIVTDDGPLLDHVQSLYERVWSGGACAGCRLRDECPGPLDERGRE